MGAEHHPANDDRIQTQGRKDNAAQPLNAAEPNAGAERYPSAGKDDGVEAAREDRSFDGPENPQPRQGAGDGGPAASTNEGRLGPGADPAEGKR
ncbi:hypothetical protein [Phenylobacterium sp.]|uniref:hypothetical protein n=1 Tax=Phenylobacterium sp. TaxID=1871053 RepID=UPI0025CC234D|nr:hypothetical protein [Phenylobacterium sp.]